MQFKPSKNCEVCQERTGGDVDPFEELERDMLDIIRASSRSSKRATRLAAKNSWKSGREVEKAVLPALSDD